MVRHPAPTGGQPGLDHLRQPEAPPRDNPPRLQREGASPRIPRGVDVYTAISTQHFDTYLIEDGRPLFHVEWSSSRVVDDPGNDRRADDPPVNYGIGPAGPPPGGRLPPRLRQVLRQEFPDYAYIDPDRRSGHR